MSTDADRSRLRVSDADRAATAEHLRIAVDEGRLDLAEYDTRLRSAYAATTYGELEPVVADLPAVPEPQQAATKEPFAPAEQAKWSKEWRTWSAGAIIMIAIWGNTSFMAGSLTAFWPAIPLGVWAAVLITCAITKKQKGGC